MHRALRPETSAQGTEQRPRVPLHLRRWSGEKPRGMLLGSSRGAEVQRKTGTGGETAALWGKAKFEPQ